MRAIPASRFWILGIAALVGCSSPYNIRLSDDRSVNYGPLHFFGWADPPLIPGTRLIDAPSGSRLVLWNDLFEAIVDLGETCPVLVKEGAGARAPTSDELTLLAIAFPDRPLEASGKADDYDRERRLERRFPSHINAHVDALDPISLVRFALDDEPAGWLALGGRAFVMTRAAERAPQTDVARLLDAAYGLGGEDRVRFLAAIVKRGDLTVPDLVKVARLGGPILAARHPAADESVCFAAIEEIVKMPYSSARRSALIDLLDAPAATPAVRERALAVPLPYPEDRDAVRAKRR